MEQPLEIHIAKPGGRREGPFSLKEINLALAARKYRSADYWAWHTGLEQWVPLYDVRGIIKVSSLAAGLARETPEQPNFQQESRAGEMPEVSTPTVNEPKEDVVAEEAPVSSPPPQLAKPIPQDSNVEEKTEEPRANIAPPVIQNAEQPLETTPNSIPAASPEIEPVDPPAPKSADEAAELAKNQADELVNADGLKENFAAEEPAVTSPASELAKPVTSFEEKTEELSAGSAELESQNFAFENSLSDLPECDHPAIEQDTVEALPPEAQKPDEQTMETTTEGMPEAAPKESCQESVPEPEPRQPVEPLATDEPSKVSKDEARDLVEKAETAATILARLKQSFFHGSEPANGVTSYFNARHAVLPSMAETGTPPLGEEWGMPEASHPLDFHSKAVPKVPEEVSSPGPETDPAAALLAHQFSSGMPFAALEQLFIFTTGDGRAIWNSPIMSRMLEAIIGEKLERIRQGTPRDVIFNCDLSKLLKRDGAISDSVWHAMEIREPTVVARAQKKLSRTCVRTFNVERDTVVALVLFYNIQKLENSSAALGSASSGTTRFTLPVNAGSSGSEHPR